MNLLKIQAFTLKLTLPLLLFAFGCQNLKTNQTNTENIGASAPKLEEQIQIPAYVVPKGNYQPTATKITDLVHTKLAVSFDWEKQYLYGEAWLTLTPHFYAQNSVAIDAKGFDIHRVSLERENNDELDLEYEYLDSLVLKINLDKSYSKEEKYTIHIQYTAKPNELTIESGSRAISEDKGLYFINPLGEDSTKPKQIWTQGETEASSCWFPTFDHPNAKTTQEIAITVDTNFVTLSNGVMEAQMFNEDGTRTDYWVHNKPHAPYLFMMAVGEFAVIYDEWLAPERQERLEVNYYVEKEFAPYAKKIFGNTPEMLGFFSKKLGYEYPWDKYAQVVVRDYVSGAMENTSASVFMEGLQVSDRELLDKNWDYIIAHELFHHWFGDLVTCESWGNLALNESFANYSEYLWFEYKYGRDYADAHRQEEIEGYLREANNKQVPIIRSHYVHRMDMFDAHSYNKGGVVLHMLRNYVGDEAFFESLRQYLKKNEFTDAEMAELRIVFEDVTGEDLNWFFNQWFFSSGHPQLTVTTEQIGDSLQLRITQIQDSLYTPYFEIPTEIEVLVANNALKRFPVHISGKETIVKIPVVDPEYVLLDPEQILLAEINQEREYSENIAIYNHSDRYQSRADAIDALTMDFANTNFGLRNPADLEKNGISKGYIDTINTKILNTIISGLSDNSEDIREQSLLILKGYDFKQKQKLESKYSQMIQEDKSSKVRANAIADLSAISKKETLSTETKNIFTKALQDSSYMVVGEALLASTTFELEGTEKYIEEFKNSDKANLIKAVGKYYIAKGEKDKDQWAIQAFKKVGSGDLISLIDVFASLTKNSSPEAQQNLINFFVTQGIEAEDIYSRYTSYRVLLALDFISGVREKRQEVIKQEKSTMLLGVYSSWEKSVK